MPSQLLHGDVVFNLIIDAFLDALHFHDIFGDLIRPARDNGLGLYRADLRQLIQFRFGGGVNVDLLTRGQFGFGGLGTFSRLGCTERGSPG